MKKPHHGWHPDRGILCPAEVVMGSTIVRLNADAVTCPDCIPLIPKPGEKRDGVYNDAGVLRRDFTAGSSK